MKNKLCILICLLSLFACSNDDGIPAYAGWEEVRVATIAPEFMLEDVKKVHNWAIKNLEEAQKDLPLKVRIVVEYYEENTANYETLVPELLNRTDIDAIVGPYYSSNVLHFLNNVEDLPHKPLVVTASSAELIRICAKSKHLWALTESDISQCEVLLTRAIMQGGRSVSLLAKKDLYGSTFIDWFAFQAMELGVEVKTVEIYDDASLETSSERAMESGADYLICVPSDVDDFKTMVQTYSSNKYDDIRLLFSDVAYHDDSLEDLGELSNGIEGVFIAADPTSGFAIAYEEEFGESIHQGDAQWYDALTLLVYGAYKQHLKRGDEKNGVNLNDMLRNLVDGRDVGQYGWRVENMYLTFRDLANGKNPDIRGASGTLNFDADVYTNVLHTYYANWFANDGKYVVLDYTSTDGDNRTDGTLAGWNWLNSQSQEFDEAMNPITYPELHDKWALLVSGSTSWLDYRHQSDVLEIYQLLKRNGYRDDRIVLIMEDNLAFHRKNPFQGVMSSTLSGENLYTDVEVDYKASELTVEDISDILLGKRSEFLPQVIDSDANDNVFVFWSGHGRPDSWSWSLGRSWAYDDFSSTLQSLHSEDKYRKMLWFVETCYAGSMARACEGLEGMLFVTASNHVETSKADTFSSDLVCYMTNRFTTTLVESLNATPNIVLRELYFKLFRNTVASHAMIYNFNNYGNMYVETMNEFLGE